MPSGIFNTVAATLFPHAHTVDLRGWGESTILPDFHERIRTTLNYGVRLRLITNAVAITEGTWELLFSKDNVVGVSIDSADRDLYNQLGRGDFDTVVRNLRTGVRVRDSNGRGLLYLKTVVSTFTLAGVPRMVTFAADLGIPQLVLNPIRCPQNHTASLARSKERISAVLGTAVELARRSGVTVRLGASLHPELAVAYGLPTTCSNPWSHALIDFKGRVGFCDHLIKKSECTLGSLTESSFEEIWNGPRFQALRYLHIEAERTRSMPAPYIKCDWCYKNRYLESEHSPFPGIESREVSTATGLPIFERGKENYVGFPSDHEPDLSPLAKGAESTVETYRLLVDRVRNRVSEAIPHGSVVAIISKGDSALLISNQVTTLHFPSSADGAYTGYHPSDDGEAVRCLEEVRHRGAQFLVFPQTAFWWLDHYQGLRAHLDTHDLRVWGDEDCIIYRLGATGKRETSPLDSAPPVKGA